MRIAKIMNVSGYTAKVKFDDEDDYLSDDLSVLSFGAFGTGYKPKLHDQVVVDTLDNGEMIIIGNVLSTDEQVVEVI